MSKWQPIETIPKDGKEYLVIERDLSCSKLVYHALVVSYQDNGLFHVSGDFWGEFDHVNPAKFGDYWCKLPKPPMEKNND